MTYTAPPAPFSQRPKPDPLSLPPVRDTFSPQNSFGGAKSIDTLKSEHVPAFCLSPRQKTEKREKKRKSRRRYLALFVHLVVGQFDLFKGDDLLAELVGAERRVRVGVEAGGSRGIRLAGHQPRGPVVGVAVALPVHGHHVQQDVVADLVALLGQAHCLLLLLQVMMVGQLRVDQKELAGNWTDGSRAAHGRLGRECVPGECDSHRRKHPP